MSSLTHRAAGAVGATLDGNRARPGIIADGVHVHEVALRVAYRQKGVDGRHRPRHRRDGGGRLAARRVRVERQGRPPPGDGAVRLPDGTLAGSTLTMDRAVRNAVALLSVSPQTAARMASETPGEILGMPDKGRIARGADADLVVLAPDLSVLETIVAGETVYKKGEAPQPRRLRRRPKSVGSGSPAGPTGSITCATISRRAIASCAIE